jgi:aminoglycoside phosphotransferase family enzyme/predicted kinase
MTEHRRDAADQGQQAIIEFLANRQCTRIDTHASIVFLEKDRVLKVKRAVRLPFLDYSTLEKRKAACDEELVINKPFAPSVYRRVVAITRGKNGLEVAGDGPAVEWAVEMARFDEEQTFDHLARAGRITPELADMLAGIIHDAHARAAVSDGASWLASLAGIIDRNTAAFRNEAELARDAVERLHEVSHRRLAGCRVLMQERSSRGLVRRCHGDAHLGNIVLIDARPVLFDAIEFDPVIATTDVLYDLAFPVMDLVHFGLNACANRLFNDYLRIDWANNADALRLLPLFLSMRAAIRANVLFTKRRLSPGDAHDAVDAKAYFDLALRHLEPARPSLIAIGGKSGTGKSVLAREAAAAISPLPGAVVLRSDVIRKELFGVDPLVALPGTAYTEDVTRRVYRTLSDRARQVVGQGLSVIVDAAFLREAERDELSIEAQKLNADFRPVFLTADLATRLSRIGSRKNDASDATREVATDQDGYDIGKLDWPTVDASGSLEQTLRRSAVFLVP